MPKTDKTPGSVLQSFLDDYQINAFSFSKEIRLSYPTVRNILIGKGKITVQTAFHFSCYFGNSPFFWLDTQIASEIEALTKNKKFITVINKIPKAVKPTGKTAAPKKAKTAKSKPSTLAEKRKQASKTPGAKPARGRRPRRK
jgi:addiction module HigA family antidote